MLLFMLGSIVLPAAGRCNEDTLQLDSASLLYGIGSHGNGVLCANGLLDGCGGNAQGCRWCLMAVVHLPWDSLRLQSTRKNYLGVKMEWDG